MTKVKKRALLIAGPTASGKSSLALALAQRLDGIIINADALQVYDNWQVLTARPSPNELLLAPHALYGHVGKTQPYSVGEWIKDVSETIDNTPYFPIIVGGTGLYFGALLNGLSRIPPVPDLVRAHGNAMRIGHGKAWFLDQLTHRDPKTLMALDQNNPARLQRAWEVLEATGNGLAYWHAQPQAPVVSHEQTIPILLNWHPNQLNSRIDKRFNIMLETGAIQECEAARADGFDPALPANRALGAREIIAALDGKISMQDAVIKAEILTHQFAKRQRTWFRSKMKNWQQVHMPLDDSIEALADEIVNKHANPL